MLLVDVYNVLHTTGILPPHLAGVDVEGLAELIAGSRFGRARAVLVCDGPAPAGGRGGGVGRGHLPAGIEIRYAGAGADADSLIERLLATTGRGGGREVLVVSSDHRLQRAARKRRARWMSSPAFLHVLVQDTDTPRRRSGGSASGRPAFATEIPLEPPAVAHWLREMGISAEDEIMRLTSSAGRAVSPSRPGGTPPQSSPPRHAVPVTPTAAVPSDPILLDPLLKEALKEWPDRLRLDDLDMSRWLTDRPVRPESAEE